MFCIIYKQQIRALYFELFTGEFAIQFSQKLFLKKKNHLDLFFCDRTFFPNFYQKAVNKRKMPSTNPI